MSWKVRLEKFPRSCSVLVNFSLCCMQDRDHNQHYPGDHHKKSLVESGELSKNAKCANFGHSRSFGLPEKPGRSGGEFLCSAFGVSSSAANWWELPRHHKLFQEKWRSEKLEKELIVSSVTAQLKMARIPVVTVNIQSDCSRSIET